MTKDLAIATIKHHQIKILDIFIELCKEANKPTTKTEILKFMNESNKIFVDSIKNEYLIEKLYT